MAWLLHSPPPLSITPKQRHGKTCGPCTLSFKVEIAFCADYRSNVSLHVILIIHCNDLLTH